ncbi:hypothetical protein [Cupriavidus alkaliphilus]|uniref:hypothetical protein n=1 Tax=Cupriavidus alkaliphilus TaxID=942866 RepID=UPI000B8616A9|nr:hypothetical protein [Cupriavidus alkaliphilus]
MMVQIIVVAFLLAGVSMIVLMLDASTLATDVSMRIAWACLAILASVLLAMGPNPLAHARVDGVLFGWRCGG